MFRVAVILVLASGAAAQAQEATHEHATPPAAAQPAADSGGFANETEKNSYALGYSLGQMINARRIEYSADPLMAGFREALAGQPGRLSDEEVTQLARQVQNAGMRRVEKERAELAAKNRAEGAAFLEANKKRSGVVTLPSGLQYEVLRQGDGSKPVVSDNVKLHFRGTLLDGTVFDSSYDREEGPVVVRPEGLILKAWTEALPLMSVGSKWKLFVPSDLGYGDKIGAVNIPPGATLIFEMELLSIESKAADQKTPGA